METRRIGVKQPTDVRRDVVESEEEQRNNRTDSRWGSSR